MIEPIRFLPEILSEVPGCPDDVAEQAVRDAAVRFARDTHAWQDEIDRVRADGRRYEYGMDFFLMVRDAEIVALTDVRVDGEPVPFSWDRSVLELDSKPKGEHLVIRGALQPVRDADRLPDLLYEQYKEAIVYQALHMLLRQNQTWAQPELAERYRHAYAERVREERISSARGHNTRPLRVQPRRFV